MNNKKDSSEIANIFIFEDTLSQCVSDPDILESILYARDHFHIYREPIHCVESFKPDASQNVLFVNCSSLEAVELLECMSSSEIAVLDFASATTPGGGALVGSKGQEEELCRLTSLYLVLNSDKLKSEYYIPNKAAEKTKAGALDYDVTTLYLPQIKVLKNSSGSRKPAQRYSNINVIVCAAPNLRNRIASDEMQLEKLVYERACRIFECAIQNQCKNIVLGAHGCGAFRNPISVVGRAYSKAAEIYRKHFDTILFAIPDKDKSEVLGNFFAERNKELENLLSDIVAWKASYSTFTDPIEVFAPDSEYQLLLSRLDTLQEQVCAASSLAPSIRKNLTDTISFLSGDVRDTWAEAAILRREELSFWDEIVKFG